MSIFRRALSLALRPPVSGHRVLAARRLPSWGPPRVPVDRKSVEERVLSTLAKHDKVDPSALSLTSVLSRDLGLDSLDLIEVSVELEDEFGVHVQDEHVDRLMAGSVSSVVELVVTLLDSLPDENRRPEVAFKEGMRAPDLS